MKRPAPNFHLPMSLFELRALITLVEAGSEAPSVELSQQRAGTRLAERAVRLLHQQGFQR